LRILIALIFWHVLVFDSFASVDYEIVIRGGRVIDPETRLDAVLNVGISYGKIQVVTDQQISGDREIAAEGLIVAPGFIDLHSHAMTPRGQHYQLHDGVTTALELEAGAFPASRVADSFASGSRIHYGASLGYLWLRQWMLSDYYQPSLIHTPEVAFGRDPGWAASGARSVFSQPLTLEQIEILRDLLRSELLKSESIGIGLPIDYMKTGLSDRELKMVFETAAVLDQLVVIHARRLKVGDTGGLDEVIQLAQATGAAVHFCHINSNALGAIETFLARVEAAQKAGIDISIEAYPYEAGSTQIGAAAFKGDWQSLYGMSHNDLVWVQTGERLTPETFHEYQTTEPGGYIVLFGNTMESVDRAIMDKRTIIASDAMPQPTDQAKVHPRGRGTFSRSLARYAREKEVLSWIDLISKMTLEPARRLESMAPAFKSKGRIQVGADADIVVFDPEIVRDRASYEDPDQVSIGFEAILVSGQPILHKGEEVPGVMPGQFISPNLTGADKTPL
jgi:imidazolonepropionase-like amidohydrolase